MSDDGWAEVDRIVASWENPSEGAAAVEMWSRDSGGYILLPLQGDWRRMAEEAAEDFVVQLNGVDIFPAVFAVCEYVDGRWHRRVIWSRKDGVKWLEN